MCVHFKSQSGQKNVKYITGKCCAILIYDFYVRTALIHIRILRINVHSFTFNTNCGYIFSALSGFSPPKSLIKKVCSIFFFKEKI